MGGVAESTASLGAFHEFFFFLGGWVGEGGVSGSDIPSNKPCSIRAVPLYLKLIHSNLASRCLPGNRHDPAKENSYTVHQHE